MKELQLLFYSHCENIQGPYSVATICYFMLMNDILRKEEQKKSIFFIFLKVEPLCETKHFFHLRKKWTQKLRTANVGGGGGGPDLNDSTTKKHLVFFGLPS